MNTFWFWLKLDPSEMTSTYESGRIILQKLNYQLDRIFLDTSTNKVFADCEFNIDIGGSLLYPDINQSCTLFLTDEFIVRISLYLNYDEYQKFIRDLRNRTGNCIRFSINDFQELEEHSRNLLNGSNQKNTFVKEIGEFALGELFA